MSARAIGLGLLATPLAAACTAAPASDVHGAFVVEQIGRELTFTEPVSATLYVDYRAVSYPGRVVEYGVEVDGAALILVYSIDPTSPRPLVTRIYDGDSLEPVLALAADDHDLDITAAGQGTLTVIGYTTPAGAQVSGAAMAIATRLRPVLDAVLPARAEIGPVPAFWQNVDQPDGSDGDVGHSSSVPRPLLPAWSAPVSVLGSLFLQSPCVQTEAGYRCPCMHVELPAVGEVETCVP